LRILAVNWQDLSNPLAGGAEIHFEEILKRVVSQGHEVSLLCCNYPGGKQHETINGIDIHRAGSRNTFNFVVPFLARRVLKKKQYDIIVEDVNKVPFYLPLFFNLPHLVVIPHLFATTIFRETNFIVASYVYLSEKPLTFVYRKSNFLAISQSTKDELVSRGIDQSKVGVAECGVDHAFYTPDASTPRLERPTLIYLGRIKKYKSVHHLIKALPLIKHQIPNISVVIVGDGDYLGALKRLTRQMNLEDTVRFTGYVSAEEKRDLLRRSHISIYPSPKEGWGITNIEANACGTPVIAANVPGLKDSVSVGKSGLLYPYGNLQKMADSIIQMLTDDDMYRSLSAGALDWAARFVWDDCANGSFAWIQKTCDERGNNE